MKMPTKKQLASIPLESEQEKNENALYDAVMRVIEKQKASTITVVRTLMRIAASGVVFSGGNVEGFLAGARKDFDEAVELKRLAKVQP